MNTAKELLVRFAKEEEGAGLIEYVLLVALIALGSIAAMGALGVSISNLFGQVNTTLTGAGAGA